MHKYASLPPKIRDSLNVSWKEGIPAQMMVAIVDTYMVPFALFLGATVFQIGFLVAIPNLIGSISQIFAVRVVRAAGNRLPFLILGATVQAFLLLPVGAFAFLSFPGQIALLIILITAYRILGNLISTVWGSLVSDYLPPHQRGEYFGWRSRIAGTAGVFALAVAGIFLHFGKKFSAVFAFFLVFWAASFCRFLSASFLRKMADSPYELKPENDFTFFMFIRRLRESNFVKYVLYVSSITFAVQLAGPYFTVLMLRDFQFSYLLFMMIQLTGMASSFLFLPLWGKHADIIGNARILKITSLLIPTIPFLWLFSKNIFYLIIVQLYAGFVWAGFELCSANFIYDAVSPEKRVRCYGYFNLFNGIALFLGASLGGFLADRLPPLLGHSIYTLLALSGIARLLAHFALSGKFHEVREGVEKVSSLQLFFSVLGIRPLSGFNRE
ncbi:MAG: MFS transporter [Candidatus Omnitrophica bacterium]|nr:MFS transporter [Candidatus Omnitrophota bacterium]